jgi:hypothetical protein
LSTKIFVSYKYSDNNVFSLKGRLDELLDPTTVRTYVDKLEEYFDRSEFAIYKGESNNEDLSYLSENEIWEKLKDRIFDSTVTLLIISPNMKEPNRHDKSQWIPWEISYSLKETTRNDRTSHSNALLAIVLPDSNKDYSYFLYDIRCLNCICHNFNTDILFDILRDNMFNEKVKTPQKCYKGLIVYSGESSYIKTVKWSDFIENPQDFINRAIEIKDHINEYVIRKEV